MEAIAWLCLLTVSLVGTLAALTLLVLRRLRQTTNTALQELATRQIQLSHKVADALAALQRSQEQQESQIATLAQGAIRLRHDLSGMQQRLEHEDDITEGSDPRLLH